MKLKFTITVTLSSKSYTMKADLTTCPPDSNRTWEERGRGSPFFSQFICGGGIPVALHSIFIEVSTKAISFSAASLLPLIAGGTTSYRKWERRGWGGVGCVLPVPIISTTFTYISALYPKRKQQGHHILELNASDTYCWTFISSDRFLRQHSQKRVKFRIYHRRSS